jgi:tetrahydromethanopterin S-methyltransferase subunit E
MPTDLIVVIIVIIVNAFFKRRSGRYYGRYKNENMTSDDYNKMWSFKNYYDK